MKILYLSCHEILEYDELRLLSGLGYQVYSLGAYTQPGGQENRKRPPLPNLPYDPHFIELATRYSRDDMHPEMLEGMDAVIVMHIPEWIEKNWGILKQFIDQGGRVIWRSIGQSVPGVERRLQPFREEGLEIVRYSPAERTIAGYIGEDAMIRFGKDPDDYKGYKGDLARSVNFTQSLQQRGKFCGLDTMRQVFDGGIMRLMVYGPGNEGLDEPGIVSGGLLSPEEQMEALRLHRLYFYTGTYPASYTLSFIEAWMTGIPVVSVGPMRGNGEDFRSQQSFEIQDLVLSGVNGFVADDIQDLRGHVSSLLQDPDMAREIGKAGREAAIRTFGTSVISEQWKSFLER